jgi:RNA polymerase sigma-70 factor (ECF subfamily)
MNETSLSLLDRVRQSADSESWRRLVGLYAPLLKRWLGQYEIQHSDAEDIVQDVLAAVVSDLPEFEHNRRTGAFRSWLRTILVHRVRNFWRSRKYRPAATGTSSLDERLDQLEDDASQMSRIWNREHDEYVIRRLTEAVRPQFEPRTWQAFHRQVIDGERADAVARGLGMSLSSVYMAKSRVLSALRRESEGLVESF